MIKIGTDIIEIARVKKAIQKPRFLEKIYTPKEIELIKKKGAKTAAANFAAKEAVAKALGNGFATTTPKDIEILRKTTGEPFVNLNTPQKNDIDIKISLSHSKEYAVAMVLIELKPWGVAPHPTGGIAPRPQ